MPKVRILCDIAGPRTLWEAGEVVQMTPAEANVWADGIRGELVAPPDETETPERTATRRGPAVETRRGR